MAYNPGISYQGGALLGRGIETAGRALAGGMEQGAERKREAKERKALSTIFRKYLETNPKLAERMGIDDLDDVSVNQLTALSDMLDMHARLGEERLQELQMEQAEGNIRMQELQMEDMGQRMAAYGDQVGDADRIRELQIRRETESLDRDALEREALGAAVRGGPAAAPPSALGEANFGGMEQSEGAAYAAGAGASPQDPMERYVGAGGSNLDTMTGLRELYQPQEGEMPTPWQHPETGKHYMVLGRSLQPAGTDPEQLNATREYREQHEIDGDIATMEGEVAALRIQLRDQSLAARTRMGVEGSLQEAWQRLNGLRRKRKTLFGKGPKDTRPAALPAPDFSEMSEVEFLRY